MLAQMYAGGNLIQRRLLLKVFCEIVNGLRHPLIIERLLGISLWFHDGSIRGERPFLHPNVAVKVARWQSCSAFHFVMPVPPGRSRPGYKTTPAKAGLARFTGRCSVARWLQPRAALTPVSPTHTPAPARTGTPAEKSSSPPAPPLAPKQRSNNKKHTPPPPQKTRQ